MAAHKGNDFAVAFKHYTDALDALLLELNGEHDAVRKKKLLEYWEEMCRKAEEVKARIAHTHTQPLLEHPEQSSIPGCCSSSVSSSSSSSSSSAAAAVTVAAAAAASSSMAAPTPAVALNRDGFGQPTAMPVVEPPALLRECDEYSEHGRSLHAALDIGGALEAYQHAEACLQDIGADACHIEGLDARRRALGDKIAELKDVLAVRAARER